MPHRIPAKPATGNVARISAFSALAAALPTAQPKKSPSGTLFGQPLPAKENSYTGLRIDPRTGLVLPNPATQARLAIIAKLTEDTCCSFDEWKAVGYWISKGSKSYFTDMLGVPQFTKEQVYKSHR